jgi:hypothetical protein
LEVYSDLSFSTPSTNFLGKKWKTGKKKKRNYPIPNSMEAKSSMQVIILCMKKHAMKLKACYA